MWDTILELIVYAIFPYFKRKKRKKEEWYGVVEEKRVEGDYSLKKQPHVVIFRTSEGLKRKMKMKEELFHRYEKGKQYRKRKGEEYPEPMA
jgi:succinate dehydrogenase/fumarate reductase flavoprotein subunit